MPLPPLWTGRTAELRTPHVLFLRQGGTARSYQLGNLVFGHDNAWVWEIKLKEKQEHRCHDNCTLGKGQGRASLCVWSGKWSLYFNLGQVTF